MPELPTGTVTFLFSNIEGSTRLLQRAARLLRAATALRETMGLPQSPALGVDTEHAVEAARATLGEEAWMAALAAGRAPSLQETIAEALQVGRHSGALPPIASTESAPREQ